MFEPDNIDTSIVELLLEDGRMPAAAIARRIGGGLTERIVRYRIDRLINEKVIQIKPIVNAESFNFTIRADVFLELETDSIMDVARKVAEYEQVTYVACSIGETDVSLQLVGRDTVEIYRFVTEVIGKIPGVRKTTTSIVPIVIKDVYQWKIPAGITQKYQNLK